MVRLLLLSFVLLLHGCQSTTTSSTDYTFEQHLLLLESLELNQSLYTTWKADQLTMVEMITSDEQFRGKEQLQVLLKVLDRHREDLMAVVQETRDQLSKHIAQAYDEQSQLRDYWRDTAVVELLYEGVLDHGTQLEQALGRAYTRYNNLIEAVNNYEYMHAIGRLDPALLPFTDPFSREMIELGGLSKSSVGSLQLYFVQVENDLLKTEHFFLSAINDHYHRIPLTLDRRAVVIRPQSAVVTVGQPYQATVQLGGYSSQADAQFSVNGQPFLPDDGGVVHYSTPTQDTGTHTLNIVAEFKHPRTGKVNRITKQYTYQVIPPPSGT